jgi:virginiamycin B lyase
VGFSLAALGLLLAPLAPAVTAFGEPVFTEYHLPTPPSSQGWPTGITNGPDGALWFTDKYNDQIGRITTDGSVTMYPALDSQSVIDKGIITGPDGAVWFSQILDNPTLGATGEIGRITVDGIVTEYPLNAGYYGTLSLTVGPDGALWFVEVGPGIGAVARMTTAGQITAYYPLNQYVTGDGITFGPDGALWFTDGLTSKIYRMTTDGSYTSYTLPDASWGGPDGITAGPDGALWFTMGAHIGRITADGQITAYPLALSYANPRFIIAGPDGALWFNEMPDTIGRITTDGQITEYATPTQNSEPQGLTVGPDGAIWFAEIGTRTVRVNTIGRLSLAPSDNTPPTTGTPAWSTNPLAIGQNTTLTVPVSDDVSGVAGGEYFIGTDPGIGNGTAMTLAGGNLSATLGANLGVGVYNIGYRAQDAAGNWSPKATTMLVIYDPGSNLSMTGKNKKDLVPSLANGDVLPGLISSTQTDAVDYGFTVEYKNGVLDSHNDFMLTYSTGKNCGKSNAQNCHTFNLNASSFDWLIADQTSNSRGRFQGVATVTVDGATTTNPFTVEGVDGDLLTPATNDTLLLKVYATGANPLTDTPIYQISGSMARGTSVKIQ